MRKDRLSELSRSRNILIYPWVLSAHAGLRFFARFSLLARVLPAGDSGRQMADVRVAELFSRTSRGLVSFALRPTAIGDYQRIFVLGKDAGQFFLVRRKINRSRNVPFVPGFSAVGVQQRDLLRRNIGFQVFDRDVFVLARIEGRRKKRASAECEDLFHEFS